MKVLYVNSPRFDYLQDIIYSGLVKALGAQNVQPYPFNKSFYFNRRVYPKNLGHNQGNFFDFIKNKISKFEYDLVIVAASKKSAFEAYLKISEKIPVQCPVIFLDGGDVESIGGDLLRKDCFDLYEKAISVRPFDLIFKREKMKAKSYADNIHACPFAFNLDRVKNVPGVQKKYDATFWAVESHEVRTQALTLLEDRYDCIENGTTKNQVFATYNRKGNFYLEELKRSRVALNFRGGGWDTLRFWEVPALSTFMLSQELDIEIPNDFVNGEHLVFCKNDLSDLIEKINYYLENEEERERIAKQGYDHLVEYHSDTARAKYILDKLK
jgi:hypothetical protein